MLLHISHTSRLGSIPGGLDMRGSAGLVRSKTPCLHAHTCLLYRLWSKPFGLVRVHCISNVLALWPLPRLSGAWQRSRLTYLWPTPCEMHPALPQPPLLSLHFCHGRRGCQYHYLHVIKIRPSPNGFGISLYFSGKGVGTIISAVSLKDHHNQGQDS